MEAQEAEARQGHRGRRRRRRNRDQERLAPAAFPAQQVSGADATAPPRRLPSSSACCAVSFSVASGSGSRCAGIAVVGSAAWCAGPSVRGSAPGSRWSGLRPSAAGASARPVAVGAARGTVAAQLAQPGLDLAVLAHRRRRCRALGALRRRVRVVTGVSGLAAGGRDPGGLRLACRGRTLCPHAGGARHRRSGRAGGRGLDPRRRGAGP